MSSVILHFSWFLIIFIISFLSLVISFYIYISFNRIFISFDLFSSWFLNLSVSFYFDLFSSWFMTLILIIRSIIMFYSFFYISPYSKRGYFIWITFLFIVSILIVVTISDLFFLMLGWDGLGLVSFFLIVYYQNQSSISSGLFTVLINRIGDSFFLVSILCFFYLNPTQTLFYRYSLSRLLVVFILITFITKRAIYPFSSWLPMAIAAPTPISALVHSSTLVTAGLYLAIRFSYLMYSRYFLIVVFLILSIFTSFYAGLNTIFEIDLKKLIALSTLSHLGFIGLAFSRGLLYLSFFHLLTHALFKSLLFMCIGDIITNMSHSQDYRFLSSGFSMTKSSFFIISVSLINLLGIPRFSGYFSKDLILETLNFSYVSRFCIFIVFINVVFTYYYTYKLFRFYFLSVNLSPYSIINFPFLLHNFLMFFLCFIGIFFGKFFLIIYLYSSIHVVVPRFIKFLPLFLNLLILIILFLTKKLPTINSKVVNYYFSSIMFLFQFRIVISSYYFLKLRFTLVKTTERGVLDKLINSSHIRMFSFLSTFFYKFFNLNPLNLLLFIFRFVFFILLLILENNIKNINDCYSLYPWKGFLWLSGRNLCLRFKLLLYYISDYLRL